MSDMAGAEVARNLGQLVERVSLLIEQTRATVATQANAALTLMNWHIGRMIDVEVLNGGRADYDREIVATLSPELGWSHFKVLLPVRTAEARAFYIEQATTARLSVRALRELIGRQGFERKEIANAQTPGGTVVPLDNFRDPYFLDFLGLRDAYAERDLEDAIIHEMADFLLEVGNGWTFVARQKRMTIDNDDFFLDYSEPQVIPIVVRGRSWRCALLRRIGITRWPHERSGSRTGSPQSPCDRSAGCRRAPVRWAHG
ncbi:PDDEXK nuclease domain-containing protein [Microbacterium sp.]|uniref:PDDEXK nuclease domain-containing protein n=1 Tax=Microbacterium sp. TaxID=51671 RepID=UPI003C7881B5